MDAQEGQSALLHGLLRTGYRRLGGTEPIPDVLFNAGNGPLSIGAITLSGSDYLMNSGCGGTLAAGASCTITVTFIPGGTGARSGVVTITDSAGTQRISLSGVGT